MPSIYLLNVGNSDCFYKEHRSKSNKIHDPVPSRNFYIEHMDGCKNLFYLFSPDSAIARVALDVHLGCMDAQVSPSTSDTQKLIDAVITFFSNVGVLELKFPFWRLFTTPTWRKYINALDTITE